MVFEVCYDAVPCQKHEIPCTKRRSWEQYVCIVECFLHEFHQDQIGRSCTRHFRHQYLPCMFLAPSKFAVGILLCNIEKQKCLYLQFGFQACLHNISMRATFWFLYVQRRIWCEKDKIVCSLVHVPIVCKRNVNTECSYWLLIDFLLIYRKLSSLM